MEARELIRELNGSPMRVILVPAPEPRHSGHMIRAVDSRPPEWYMEIYKTKGRKTFKRWAFMRALKRIAKGAASRGTYETLAMNHIKKLIGA